ncbi:MAG TPA: LPXTG cell wall anchor domain-containing protein [Bryobacteraceae bacterium]|jgi:LPXTG-motif cell wall-anchored protein|nr:LPXTG cell wall anchor domain-containing protein [Bryobacteraceae bacterium]
MGSVWALDCITRFGKSSRPNYMTRKTLQFGARAERRRPQAGATDKEKPKMSKATTMALVCAGLLAAMLPRATADEWNQKTYFTFNQPVELPGQVLDPGTYVFKVMDSPSNRDIVQVFNKRENHCYGTFLTIPDYRMNPPSKPVITFEERAAGSPEAVHAWWYPGRNYGHEFVYHKVKEMAMAQTTTQQSEQVATNTTETTTQAVQQPATTEMNQEQTTVQPPAEEQTPAPQPVTPAPAPQEEANRTVETPPATLPKTDSPLPLFALLGLASLAGAGLLSRVAAAMKARQ